jgi:structure-specific recognition protein 1
MTTESVIEFEGIYHVTPVAINSGKLRISPLGIGFKSKSNEILTVSANEIEFLYWSRGSRDFRLSLANHSFDGFKGEYLEQLKSICRRYYGIDIEVKEYCVRGWNWGSIEYEGKNDLQFSVGKLPSLRFPLNLINSASLAAKNELALEFKIKEVKEEEDQLVEMRFFIPEEEEAKEFFDNVKMKADLESGNLISVVSFHELPFAVPRGRYDVEMYLDSFRMRGKTYDFKISYKNIHTIFQLPRGDLHTIFVFNVDPPLRQGQTRYSFLILQFLNEEEIDITLTMDEDNLKQNYPNLQKNYDCSLSVAFASILESLLQKPLKLSTYTGFHGSSGVSCSHKANEGTLYPLDDCLLFIPKPALYMRHEDIVTVTVSSSHGQNMRRTLDIIIKLRSLGDLSFSLPKEEWPLLEKNLQKHNLTVVGQSENTELHGADKDGTAIKSTISNVTLDDSDESDDEDFVAEDQSDVEEEFDEEYSSGTNESEEENSE